MVHSTKKRLTDIETHLQKVLAEEIQKEIDGDIIWYLTEEKDWPYSVSFLHFNGVKDWLDEHYTEGVDYVYRTGNIYFKDEKVYTWFTLRWSDYVPHYRRA